MGCAASADVRIRPADVDPKDIVPCAPPQPQQQHPPLTTESGAAAVAAMTTDIGVSRSSTSNNSNVYHSVGSNLHTGSHTTQLSTNARGQSSIFSAHRPNSASTSQAMQAATAGSLDGVPTLLPTPTVRPAAHPGSNSSSASLPPLGPQSSASQERTGIVAPIPSPGPLSPLGRPIVLGTSPTPSILPFRRPTPVAGQFGMSGSPSSMPPSLTPAMQLTSFGLSLSPGASPLIRSVTPGILRQASIASQVTSVASEEGHSSSTSSQVDIKSLSMRSSQKSGDATTRPPSYHPQSPQSASRERQMVDVQTLLESAQHIFASNFDAAKSNSESSSSVAFGSITAQVFYDVVNPQPPAATSAMLPSPFSLNTPSSVSSPDSLSSPKRKFNGPLTGPKQTRELGSPSRAPPPDDLLPATDGLNSADAQRPSNDAPWNNNPAFDVDIGLMPQSSPRRGSVALVSQQNPTVGHRSARRTTSPLPGGADHADGHALNLFEIRTPSPAIPHTFDQRPMEPTFQNPLANDSQRPKEPKQRSLFDPVQYVRDSGADMSSFAVSTTTDVVQHLSPSSGASGPLTAGTNTTSGNTGTTLQTTSDVMVRVIGEVSPPSPLPTANNVYTDMTPSHLATSQSRRAIHKIALDNSGVGFVIQKMLLIEREFKALSDATITTLCGSRLNDIVLAVTPHFASQPSQRMRFQAALLRMLAMIVCVFMDAGVKPNILKACIAPDTVLAALAVTPALVRMLKGVVNPLHLASVQSHSAKVRLSTAAIRRLSAHVTSPLLQGQSRSGNWSRRQTPSPHPDRTKSDSAHETNQDFNQDIMNLVQSISTLGPLPARVLSMPSYKIHTSKRNSDSTKRRQSTGDEPMHGHDEGASTSRSRSPSRSRISQSSQAPHSTSGETDSSTLHSSHHSVSHHSTKLKDVYSSKTQDGAWIDESAPSPPDFPAPVPPQPHSSTQTPVLAPVSAAGFAVLPRDDLRISITPNTMNTALAAQSSEPGQHQQISMAHATKGGAEEASRMSMLSLVPTADSPAEAVDEPSRNSRATGRADTPQSDTIVSTHSAIFGLFAILGMAHRAKGVVVEPFATPFSAYQRLETAAAHALVCAHTQASQSPCRTDVHGGVYRACSPIPGLRNSSASSPLVAAQSNAVKDGELNQECWVVAATQTTSLARYIAHALVDPESTLAKRIETGILALGLEFLDMQGKIQCNTSGVDMMLLRRTFDQFNNLRSRDGDHSGVGTLMAESMHGAQQDEADIPNQAPLITEFGPLGAFPSTVIAAALEQSTLVGVLIDALWISVGEDPSDDESDGTNLPYANEGRDTHLRREGSPRLTKQRPVATPGSPGGVPSTKSAVATLLKRAKASAGYSVDDTDEEPVIRAMN